MAEGYLKYRLKQLGKDTQVNVTSAGTYAVQGETSPKFAKRAIEKYGANIDYHTASTLNNSNIKEATYVLVMTERHKRDVVAKYPEVAEKIILLGEYAKDKKYDQIDDPWGYSYDVYQKCAQEIVDSIEGFIAKEL